MSRFVKIGEAAKLLGVSVQTLRRWERDGEFLPDRRSNGKTRYYDIDRLKQTPTAENKITIAYARVSSNDQKEDLKREVTRLEDYCAAKGYHYEVIQDLGSGMNYRKKGLKRLLDLILSEKIARVVLTNKDTLLRFGAELIFSSKSAEFSIQNHIVKLCDLGGDG